MRANPHGDNDARVDPLHHHGDRLRRLLGDVAHGQELWKGRGHGVSLARADARIDLNATDAGTAFARALDRC